MFGGKDGIEAIIEADEKLKANKIDQIFNFNCELNENYDMNELYGSRTIRLEVNNIFLLIDLRLFKKFKLFFCLKGSNFDLVVDVEADDFEVEQSR